MKPLENKPIEILTTAEAAKILRLTPATLHEWAKAGNSPIQPLRYNRRKLMWRVSDVRALLAGELDHA